jgi:hypothetical protein
MTYHPYPAPPPPPPGRHHLPQSLRSWDTAAYPQVPQQRQPEHDAPVTHQVPAGKADVDTALRYAAHARFGLPTTGHPAAVPPPEAGPPALPVPPFVPGPPPASPGWRPPAPGWQPDNPGAWGQSSPDPGEAALIRLRNTVIDKLSLINAKHCLAAFDNRDRRDALSPHGIVFLYAEPGRRTDWITLKTARRYFYEGPESADLPALLSDLTTVASTKADTAATAGQTWLPGTGMESRRDRLHPEARYVGVAVSTLDMPDLTWAQASRAANSPLELPGRAMALLTDGTALLVVRRSHRGFGESGVFSTANLEAHAGESLRFWTRSPRVTAEGNDLTQHIWQNLHVLHTTLAGNPSSEGPA